MASRTATPSWTWLLTGRSCEELTSRPPCLTEGPWRRPGALARRPRRLARGRAGRRGRSRRLAPPAPGAAGLRLSVSRPRSGRGRARPARGAGRRLVRPRRGRARPPRGPGPGRGPRAPGRPGRRAAARVAPLARRLFAACSAGSPPLPRAGSLGAPPPPVVLRAAADLAASRRPVAPAPRDAHGPGLRTLRRAPHRARLPVVTPPRPAASGGVSRFLRGGRAGTPPSRYGGAWPTGAPAATARTPGLGRVVPGVTHASAVARGTQAECSSGAGISPTSARRTPRRRSPATQPARGRPRAATGGAARSRHGRRGTAAGPAPPRPQTDSTLHARYPPPPTTTTRRIDWYRSIALAARHPAIDNMARSK